MALFSRKIQFHGLPCCRDGMTVISLSCFVRVILPRGLMTMSWRIAYLKAASSPRIFKACCRILAWLQDHFRWLYGRVLGVFAQKLKCENLRFENQNLRDRMRIIRKVSHRMICVASISPHLLQRIPNIHVPTMSGCFLTSHRRCFPPRHSLPSSASQSRPF